MANAPPWSPFAGAQSEFARDQSHRYLFFEGGWAAGKTWIGARKLLWLHTANAFDKSGKPTGVPSAVIAPTYQAAKDYCILALSEAMDELGFIYEIKENGSLANGKYGSPGILIKTLSTNRIKSVILVRTADAPEHITGWEVGATWGDEPTRWPENEDPKRDPYMQLIGRVRHPKSNLRQVIFTYTNEGTKNRIYKVAHSGDADVAVFRASTRQNPVLKDFVADLTSRLSPELADQYIEGGAIDLASRKVYPYFNAAIHIQTGMAWNSQLPLCIMFDFNSNPGMHCLLGQYDPDADQFQIMHEFFQMGLDLRRLLTDLLPRWLADHGDLKFPELHLFGDASASSRLTGHAESNWDIVRQAMDTIGHFYRLRIPNANPFVEDRVNSFNAALLDIAGDSHLKCDPTCTRLINDLSDMARNKDGLIDKSDSMVSHASDATGYCVWYLRPIRRQKIESGKVNVP